MATTHLKNFIDGRWVDSSSGQTFEDTDPANGQLIATATKSNTADADKAIEAAKRAADAWRLYPAPKRGEILYRAAEIMLGRKDDLARDMTIEMGKVLAESRGDVQEGIDMTYYIAGEGRRQFGDVVPAELPEQVGDEHAAPARRRRRDHALELPVRDPDLEDHAGADPRKHRRLQAGVVHADDGRPPGRDPRGSRTSEGRAQPRARLRRGSRRPHRQASAAWTSSRSRARATPARTSARSPGGSSSASRPSSAGRTRSSCSTTRTSTSRSRGSCGPRSARPGSAAPRPRGSSRTAASRTI